ncbi:HAD superfamily protein [Babesia gibsoni]|uniref:HAD superfamily protein n=1 Tax=Babesia gibsoni TaxID=33632 RepID=A0AAD8LKZ6_BABGI|nr:HAD superfamily protein [Babesia gibsoni]
MDAFCDSMRKCIADKVFHTLSVEDAVDKFVTLLEQNGFKYVASDFDATMIEKHSGGCCHPKDVDLLSSVTSYFKAMGERLKRSPLKLVVVTHSDDTRVRNHPVLISGSRMVAKALHFSNCTADIQKICADFGVKLNEIIIIDDDINNCRNAKKIGAAALHVLRRGFKLTEVELL